MNHIVANNIIICIVNPINKTKLFCVLHVPGFSFRPATGGFRHLWTAQSLATVCLRIAVVNNFHWHAQTSPPALLKWTATPFEKENLYNTPPLKSFFKNYPIYWYFFVFFFFFYRCNSTSPSGTINMQTLIKKHFEVDSAVMC